MGRWFSWGWWLIGLCAVQGTAGWAQLRADTGIYSCQDGSGRRITSDRPIPTCSDREQRLLGNSGVEKKRIVPSLSEQERYEAEQRQRRQARQQQLSQDGLRREQAMIQRYPRPDLHQAARREALAQVDEVIAVASQRMEALRVERGQQEQEMAFYAKDPTLAPPSLQRNLAEIDVAMERQLRYLQEQQQERRRVQQRFDSEQQQLQRLWQQAEEQGMPR